MVRTVVRFITGVDSARAYFAFRCRMAWLAIIGACLEIHKLPLSFSATVYLRPVIVSAHIVKVEENEDGFNEECLLRICSRLFTGLESFCRQQQLLS